MKIFIIGAAGKIGRRLVRRLADRGHTALALHRKHEQAAELAALGAVPVAGDLTRLSVEALAELMRGADAVVFTAGAAGAGPELTDAIDGRGLETAAAAARITGIARFLLVSAFPEALRDRGPSDGFEHYIRVKKLADAHLAASDLDYVILRPGTLTDDPGTGRVRADLALPYDTISRDDVALALASVLECPEIGRTIIELTVGDQPIDQAFARLAVWGSRPTARV